MRETICSILSRAFRRFRVIVIGSNSASKDISIVRQVGGPLVHLVRRGGKNMSTTEGQKVRRTHFRCVTFLSTSSR